MTKNSAVNFQVNRIVIMITSTLERAKCESRENLVLFKTFFGNSYIFCVLQNGVASLKSFVCMILATL